MRVVVLVAALVLSAAPVAGARPVVERDVATGVSAGAPGAARVVRAAPPRVSWHMGAVLHSTRSHVIFWQPPSMSFDSGYAAVIERFLANVAASSHSSTNVFGLTGQYRDRGGPAAYASSFAGAVVDADPLPGNGCHEPRTAPAWSVCLTDDQLQAEIRHVVAADRLPRRAGDIYLLVLPNGFGNCLDSSSSSCALGGSNNGYCGYHLATSDGIPYAVIPYNAISGHCQSDNPRPNHSTADPVLSTIAHEETEVVTDPFGGGWSTTDGEEIADLCLEESGPVLGGGARGGWNQVIAGGHYFLQSMWSNATRACVARAPGDRVSVGGPRRVRTDGRATFVAHTSATGRRAVAWLWSFGGRGARVSHAWRRSGRYRVLVRVTDSWGNWGFGARVVRVS